MSQHVLQVLKFGGSSLATPEQIRAVAARIKARHDEGKKLIVVTSAMGKTTDQLNELAYRITARPNRRELDMLLSTGERVSMALMSMALHDMNCPSISFTGSQAGIMTDGAFSNARIKELKPIRVEEALKENRVVVLAGFQGVDPITKEVTTLGRGGSDTTAVAMAAHFRAERCEILKDVDGVFAADPSIVPTAKLYRQLPIDVLHEFCFWGAKVLNYRSVELAREREVPLFVGRSDDFAIGTQITLGSSKALSSLRSGSAEGGGQHLDIRDGELLGVQSHKQVLEVTIESASTEDGLTRLESLLAAQGLPPAQILSATHAAKSFNALITADADLLRGMKEVLQTSSYAKIVRDGISTVTASYAGQPCKTVVVDSADREATIRKYF